MSPTVADHQTEIRTLIEIWEKAAANKDARAIAAFYADNATLLPPGMPAIKGRQNIQNFWQGLLDAGASDARLKSVEIRGAEPFLYEIGEYSAVMPQPTGGTAPGTGKYLVVWERQSDGTLKMVADMFSSNA
jgi:uncharacterized protein (TIGR02246 family)